MNSNQSRGYLVCATLAKPFYEAAIEMIKGLKDEVPDAKVAFFTHDDWIEDEHRPLIDHLFTHTRAQPTKFERR